jgi:DNA-binding transcriptional ArsR family regulator
MSEVAIILRLHRFRGQERFSSIERERAQSGRIQEWLVRATGSQRQLIGNEPIVEWERALRRSRSHGLGGCRCFRWIRASVKEKGKSFMATNKHEFRTAIFDDGTCAVLRAAPNKPHLLEVIATFHDAARARDYIRLESNSSDEHPAKRPVKKQAAAAKPKRASKAQPKQAAAAKPTLATQTKSAPAAAAKPKQATPVKREQAVAGKLKPASAARTGTAGTGVSDRQEAVLKALRSLMDKKHRVEATGAHLAKASSIPAGSLHSVLVSLEKKGLIRTERQGSAKLRAIYEVLQASPKSARTALNGVVRGKAAHAGTVAH